MGSLSADACMVEWARRPGLLRRVGMPPVLGGLGVLRRSIGGITAMGILSNCGMGASGGGRSATSCAS